MGAEKSEYIKRAKNTALKTNRSYDRFKSYDSNFNMNIKIIVNHSNMIEMMYSTYVCIYVKMIYATNTHIFHKDTAYAQSTEYTRI